MGLVLVGAARPQAVVDVQRRDLAGAEQAHRQVEQADRVAAAGDHRDERLAGRQQAVLADPLQHARRLALRGAAHTGGAALITNSSVGSGNPLRVTSPIGSARSRSLLAIARTTRSVASSSPAWARLTTRWARLTWVPK